ncbi:hypothetical protein IMCC1989_2194 [gamma proteobacterium IMCC1989]|nr:hypothetical protein IMCC1989_2194 [gamma proteobacterium IMCC1989]
MDSISIARFFMGEFAMVFNEATIILSSSLITIYREVVNDRNE